MYTYIIVYNYIYIYIYTYTYIFPKVVDLGNVLSTAQEAELEKAPRRAKTTIYIYIYIYIYIHTILYTYTRTILYTYTIYLHIYFASADDARAPCWRPPQREKKGRSTD